ncbi:MAG TPA: hypothetical protein DDZ51_31195 [Planctomycetaceae bacterium]|nr:hypothetical protein [Planctomycetaceae bacterium]
MHLQTTGFVSTQAGSVASANSVILAGLLGRGHRVTFYTKPSFVDPRMDIREPSLTERLNVVDCTNQRTDALWRTWGGKGMGLSRTLLGRMNAWAYNRGLVRAMGIASDGDVDLWLGDWAHGRARRPVISFVQGPPGTDAESIAKHRELIERLAGKVAYCKLRAYALWRLSFGLPPFHFSDAVIVGSEWSRRRLIARFGLSPGRVHAVPYPIDLQAFAPPKGRRSPSGRLRLLWLGRFVPRKRLDLMLAGLEAAIRDGCDVELWVVGQSGFVPNYERLLDKFRYSDRIKHWGYLSRETVPDIIHDVDVMVQPSDDENFGSSVAEALACGVASIVGATNGTGDYVCERSIRLDDDQPQTLARAIMEMSQRKKLGLLEDPAPSRAAAEANFSPKSVCLRLEAILKLTAESTLDRP